jgi:disulfide bond formation protein DsbB
MTKFQKTALLAAAGSAGMMVGALTFQYGFDMAPCKMCIWQRWPHVIAIVLGALIYFFPNRFIALLSSLVVLVGGGIGVYHAGVEQKWWEGPTDCTGTGLSLTDNLLDMTAPINVVMCDVIPWSMFGISMAGWNAIISFGLVYIWIKAFRTA